MKFIIGGYEQGGTTLLSDIFRANGFESGFECGVLLSEMPSEMPKQQPYWDMLLDGWGITDDVRARAATGDFEFFYNTISKAAFPDFQGTIFDKTPKYMECLGLCLKRGKFLKGAVIIHRDPRAIFVSMTKRFSPDLSIVEGIEKNFEVFQNHYLSYFIGSIGHIKNDNVLFVPFEEMVSREQAWLAVLGHFAIGRPFAPRTKASRFENVEKSNMDLGKVIEFDQLLPPSLQMRILVATQLASPFFCGPVERVRYSEMWEETITTARHLLHHFDLPDTGLEIEGFYFEPLTYLIRYPDVRLARLNPVEHFKKYGRREKRLPH